MLFQVNAQSKIEIDPVYYGVPAVKQVIAKDKDRQKRNAIKEMLFVYFNNDYRSPYMDKSEKTRPVHIKQDIDLPVEWEPCPKVKRLEDWYVKRQDTASIRSLKAVRGALVTSTNGIEAIKDVLDQKVEDYRGGDTDVDLSTVTKLITELLSLSDKLPKAIETISNLTEKVKKEASGDGNAIRGGGEVGEYED